MLLFHLLFEEYSSEAQLMRQALENMTLADYKQRIYLMPATQTEIKLDENNLTA